MKVSIYIEEGLKQVNLIPENTNKVMNDTFWIGVYPKLTIDQLDFMVDKIKEFVDKNN